MRPRSSLLWVYIKHVWIWIVFNLDCPALNWTCELWWQMTVQHTSASLTINENYDSDVRDDTETFLNRIVPEVHFSQLPLPTLIFFFHLWTTECLIVNFLCAGVICALEAYTGGLVFYFKIFLKLFDLVSVFRSFICSPEIRCH